MKRKVSEILENNSQKFKWTEILSEFTESKTKEEKNNALMVGMNGHVPYEADMVREWKSPFLFGRFFLVAIALLAVLYFGNYMIPGIGVSAIVLAPFVITLTMVLFAWEMNIPKNISIVEVIKIFCISGVVGIMLAFVVEDMTVNVTEEVTPIVTFILRLLIEVLLICLFLRKGSYRYGLNGVTIGTAVGAGYTAFWFVTIAIMLLDAGGDLAFADKTAFNAAFGLMILGVIGCDTLRMGICGGALALAKGKEGIKIKHFTNSLFLISFIGSLFMSVLWTYDYTTLFERFADSKTAMTLYKILVQYNGIFIILIVVECAFFLMILRKCVEQTVLIANKERENKKIWDNKMSASSADKVEIYGLTGVFGGQKINHTEKSTLFGRDATCKVQYAGNVQGISAVHCEIKKQGNEYVLIDKNSSFGTFFSDGTKLNPEVPYTLKNGDEFYLASEENAFKVGISKNFTQTNYTNSLQYGIRTNEVDEEDSTGKNVVVTCCIVLVVLFVIMYAISSGSIALTGDSTDTESEEVVEEVAKIQGAWTCAGDFDIKSIVTSNIDNVATVVDIGLFKKSYANGLTFTQEGNLYATCDGVTIDYAQFTYEIIDEETIQIQWDYQTAEAAVGVKIVEVSKDIGDETGYTAKYALSADGEYMEIDFFGEILSFQRY